MSSSDSLADLAVAERNELEALLMDFDQQWEPKSLETFNRRVASHPESRYRMLALSELVKVDLQRGWSAGKGRMLETYLEQFSSLGNPSSVSAELIVAELEARNRVDSSIELASYEPRFPNQFSSVQQLVSQGLESGHSHASLHHTQPELAQASIDTSRIDSLRDTSIGKQQDGTVSDLPVEFGRYRILKQLGSGAMGKVYLAHDSQLDRQVALKTPSFIGSDEDDMVTRFYREARAAAKLQHRNICPIYDVGKIAGRHFISMAFVKGNCLADFIRPNKLPPQRTSAILIQRLAAALAEAHQHNVIHRDLKPANIMIDSKREPIVMDFGLARQTDVESRVTQSGMAVGTPAYMSPEQIRGDLDDVGTTADIYALGVILYELLTGQLPFRGSIAKVVYSIVHEEPTAPSQICNGVDAELEAICVKMMAKDRSDRFQSMGEVAAALKTYLKAANRSSKAGKATSRTTSNVPPCESSTGQLTETGALNAFFAARAEEQPQRTSIEPAVTSQPVSVADIPAKPTRTGPRGRKRNRPLWIASGIVGSLLLFAGIVIYFIGGKVELDSGSDAVVNVDQKGNLSIQPGAEAQASTAPIFPTQDTSETKPEVSIASVETPAAEMENATPDAAQTDNQKITIPTLTGTTSLAVAPTGRHFAHTSNSFPASIGIWDTQTGALDKKIQMPDLEKNAPSQLAYSPDGKWIFFSSGNTCRKVSVETAQHQLSQEFPSPPLMVVFPSSPLVMALYQTEDVRRQQRHEVPQKLRIWNWQSDDVLVDVVMPITLNTELWFPAVSPDERFISFAWGQTYVRYELSILEDRVTLGTRSLFERLGRIRGPLVFSPDCKYAAGDLKSLEYMGALFDVDSRAAVVTIDPETAKATNSGNRFRCNYAFSADGDRLISSDHNGRVVLFKVPSGELIREVGHYNPNGQHSPPLVAVTAGNRLIIAGDFADSRITIQSIDGTITPR